MTTHTSSNLALRVADHAARTPDHIAFEVPGGPEVSYAELDRMTARFGAAIAARGVRPQDRVAARLGKSTEAIAVFLAVLRIGAIYVPINPQFTETEAGVILEEAEPALLVTEGSASGAVPTVALSDLAAALAGDCPDLDDPDALAVMLFTSGTTGRPKGAPLSHRALMSNLEALCTVWEITARDRLLHVLPIFHAHGLFIAAGTLLLAGGTIRLMPQFDAAEACAHLPGTTLLMAVPAIYTRLLAHEGFDKETTRDLRLMISGSSPLSTETFDAIGKKTGHVIVERYGMTETSILTSNPVAGARKVGSVGLPLPCVSVRIVDDTDRDQPAGEVGRILVKTPCIGSGYWRRPGAPDFARTDGWFVTGDLGYLDAEGYLWISGREKDLIISGGFNVYSREIEMVIEKIDGVREVAVFGVPHPDFGEGVVAAVESDLSPDSLTPIVETAVRDNLTAYKRPKTILVTSSLPRNAMGKPLKAELRAIHASQFQQQART